MFDRLAELRRKQENGEGGFTLIELLVVVVIIGILIAIAIPLYLNYQKSSNDKAAQSDLRNAVSLLETCNSDNGSYPTANFSLTVSGPAGTCATKNINVSSGTTLNYYVNTSGTAGTSYLIVATNSNGNVTGGTNGYYCYAQAAGGSVSKRSSANTPAAYATACS